jgi:CRP-like cAMP-binding protein
MTSAEILNRIGRFSAIDGELFEQYTVKQSLHKNEILVQEGDICQAFYFILQGAFVQYTTKDTDEIIVDLHLENEWMFNQESLTEQRPSTTHLKAFSNAEILSLSLHSLHYLCAQSQGFLQFGKILNQTKYRTSLFDGSLNPLEKYQFITKHKPALTQIFPLKLIASYLKVTPETLSRVRASF